jgi:BirA family biotin operon repressor/biotin-[acetyl-CoA-carboxylase] ligase
VSPGASWLGARVVELAACGSTNDEALQLARAGAAHGTVVIADAQTAGRGRDGRAWASPPGTGLYLSAIVRPRLPLDRVPPLTLAIGVGACDAAREHGAHAELKWPNDLLVAHRKLGGILVEAHSQGAQLDCVIVGIGINLAPLPAAHGDLAASAISLAEAAGAREPVDRRAVIASLLAHVGAWIDAYVAGGLSAIIPAWHARMAQGLAARAAEISGAVVGLDTDGALLLRDAAGRVHRVRSGDVQVVRDPAATR